MDGTGSETSKRQRLDYNNGSHRMQQQSSISQSHNYPVNTLPPPNSYPSQPPPPSPYHQSVPHEHRSLPEPSPHSFTQPHSGHNTPIRDLRSYPVDNTYSRRGSASGSTRSPDGYEQFATTRSLNNATVNDGQHYSSQYPTEHVGHFSGYPSHDGPLNGNPHHGLPMSNYSDQPHPIPSGHPGDYGQSPVNNVQNPYSSSSYSGPSNPNMNRPKKGSRATQACDVCRMRKAKCDEGRPACTFCNDNQMPCNYQTVAPAKADRATNAILEQLGSLQRDLHENHAVQEKLEEKFESWETRFDRMEQLISNLGNPRHGLSATTESPDVKSGARHPHESSKKRPTTDHRITSLHPPPKLSDKELKAVEASPSGSLATVGTESSGVESSVTYDTPARVDHTTAAHRLLRWPSIRAVISKSKTASSWSEDYVMNLEEKKGVLRVYGRGEGQDASDGGHPSSPSSSTASVRSDETSEARSPPSAIDWLWGAGFADTKPMSEVGGLNPDGQLNIDPQTLRRLLTSYLDNIHILHPFLDKNLLTRMVERFSMIYNPSEKDRKWTKLLFTAPAATMSLDGRRESSGHVPKSAKRKLSDGYYPSSGQDVASTPGQTVQQPPLERSISTSIVLLVMALGKICEWRDPLPGPVPDDIKEPPHPRPQSYSPLASNTESPTSLSVRQSPALSAQSMANISMASPMSGVPVENTSPRQINDDPLPGARNVDVIPGLAYYAHATDILGNCHGGNDLAHVQASLLAGLYAGQLARTFESWSWIHTACRACRYLVRDPKLKKERDPRKDLIKFAFWTCLQLESDILAELDLPRSGIDGIEGVAYPNGFVEQADFEHDVNSETKMFYYSGQIHIRGILNDIQAGLHPAKEDAGLATKRVFLRNQLDEMLTRWRKILPEKLQWSDDDPPSRDINDARLRAKFYGAQYIIHRPFLRHALDNEVQSQDIRSPQSDVFRGSRSSYSSQPKERRSGAMAPPRPSVDKDAQADILHSAKTCVSAAMQSTTAFDNIIDHKRLIVTNIFGTAHAQFGNIMVLATTYKSSSLSFLVPRKKLEHLFDRTIKFLRRLRHISTTLEHDARILEIVREVVFEVPDTGASFSSND